MFMSRWLLQVFVYVWKPSVYFGEFFWVYDRPKLVEPFTMILHDRRQLMSNMTVNIILRHCLMFKVSLEILWFQLMFANRRHGQADFNWLVS